MIASIAVAQPNPDYPRVNPSAWYEVDPDWPAKPDGVTWAAVPGVTLDATGNVWMFSRTDPAVQVYSAEGMFLFGWGDRPGAHHLAIDAQGFVWTTDVARHIVQKHEADGTVVLTLGTDGEMGESPAHFFKPTDVDFASNGDILVADGYGNARIVRFDATGKFVTAWGRLGTEPSAFSIPHAIAVDSQDRVYVADRNNARIQVFDLDGTLLDSWQHIVIPWGLTITDDDAVWVCGSTVTPWDTDPEGGLAPLGVPPKDQIVVRFDTQGKVIELHSFPKGADGDSTPGALNWVHCIAVDTNQNLYLGDINGERLQKFLRRPAG